jgi:hypothetical protein
MWGIVGYILTDCVQVDLDSLEKLLLTIKSEKKADSITKRVLEHQKGESISVLCLEKNLKPIFAGSLKPIMLELDYFQVVLF